MALPPNLPRVCACIGHADAGRAEALALASCAHGEALVELRIDALADPSLGPGIVAEVVARHPSAFVLATCRRRGNSGGFDGRVSDQLALLRRAADRGARIVDIEIETLEAAPGALEAFRGRCLTLASYHDFERTGPLDRVVRKLEATGADILKVATRVNRPTDNLALLDLCRARRNMVVAGMGEEGSIARLVSPQRGGLFTYAAPDSYRWPAGGPGGETVSAGPTAPGQVSARAARLLYRIPSGTGATGVYAVIARPVGHSLSPLIHNRAFEAVGFDGIYVPLLVRPSHVPDFFDLARRLPVRGASVTIPHKQAVIPLLDSVDETAREIGAVNTIYWRGGQLAGTNTDARGIVSPLLKRTPLDGATVLVVGNGGAAKAAVTALRQEGCLVSVTGRNPARVGRLAQEHGVRPLDFADATGRSFDILVQATPVGMTPDVDGNLFPGRVPAKIVFDLVYNPLETVLLRHAADQGRTVISGIEMFVEQAAEQFRIWTGMEAPRAVMRDALLAHKVK